MATFTVLNDLASGSGSLKQMILDANALGGSNEIIFASSLAGETIIFGSILTQRGLEITSDLTINGDINGDGAADITLIGDDSRVFEIYGANIDVELRSLTLTGDPHALNADGGAILVHDGATVSIVNSTIENSKARYGGAIYVSGGAELNLVNSTLSFNNATSRGGGIAISSSGTAHLINATIAHNSTDGFGGGIRNQGTLTLDNSTIVGNQSDADGTGLTGGGLFATGTETISNTIIADNSSGENTLFTSAVANDVGGTINTATNSFFGTSATISNDTNNIINGGDPMLSLLRDNGGAVDTMTILYGSQLTNAGNASLLPADSLDLDGDGNTTEDLPEDADGNARVNDGALDIGAVESNFFIVDNLDDVDDGNYNAGQLSLREAIDQVATDGTIYFAAGLAGQTIILKGAALDLTRDVTIDGDVNGDGRADITISGNDASRIFNISGAGTEASLFSLTLTDGNAGGFSGGAVWAYSDSTVNIIQSTISDSYGVEGGAIYVSGGAELNLVSSTLSENEASHHGGGISISGGGTANLVNATIASNITDGFGGGISNDGTLTVEGGTIVGNQADANGPLLAGGGLRAAGTESIYNTVIANNTSSNSKIADDVLGSLEQAKHSFFGTDTTFDSGSGNINDGGTPLLGALQDNGGPVETMAIEPLSPLLRVGLRSLAGTDEFDLDGDGNLGEILPVDANGNNRTNYLRDIGAVESALHEVDTLSSLDDGNYSAGNLSIREVIEHFSGNVTFGAHLSGQTITVGIPLRLLNSTTIDGDIDGDGEADITLSGDGNTNIFYMNNLSPLGGSNTVNLRNLNITDGYSDFNGGGGAITILNDTDVTITNSTITNSTIVDWYINGALHKVNDGGGISLGGQDSTLKLVNSTVSGNTSEGGNGGGLAVILSNTLEIINSTVSDNTAVGYGGGISVYGGTLNTFNSTISGNHSGESGGGIGINSGEYLYIANSSINLNNTTIANNTANDFGGGVFVPQFAFGLDVYNSTISGNHANGDSNITDNGIPVLPDEYGGGVLSFASSNTTYINSVIAGNTVGASNISHDVIGGITTAINSFFGTNATIGNDTNNINGGGDPLLGELLYNGGTNLTFSPLDDSPLIGAGSNVDLPADIYDIDNDGNTAEPLPLDARGGVRILDSTLDIGAVEQFEDEIIHGTEVANTIIGGLGRDQLYGEGGDDELYGGAGRDKLYGGEGGDAMHGGDDNDIFYVQDAGDTVSEDFDEGYDVVYATGVTNFTLEANVERLIFTDTIDHIGKGNAGDNRLNGNAGKDKFLIDEGGADIFSGGHSRDVFDARASTTGIKVYLNNQDNNAGATAGDVFASIEVFSGSSTAGDTMRGGTGRSRFAGNGGDDVLIGNNNIDFLQGGADNDTIYGGSGRDTLQGGSGDDILDGGNARDQFLYVKADFGHDTIVDFQDDLDYFKVWSGNNPGNGVADDISDFTITGNGTSTVTVTLNADPTSIITVNSFDGNAMTIDAGDFQFY